MVVTVFVKAWPSFRANGLAWFGSGGNVDLQLRAMDEGIAAARPLDPLHPRLAADLGDDRHDRPGRVIALVGSTLAAIFLTEFAPGAGAADARADHPAARRRALGGLRAGRRSSRSRRGSTST